MNTDSAKRPEQAEGLADPFLCALAAVPDDDEPLTDEDRAAIEVGWEDCRQGRTFTLDELRRTELNEAG